LVLKDFQVIPGEYYPVDYKSGIDLEGVMMLYQLPFIEKYEWELRSTKVA
jgi:hypothetical protein